jgi:hypothetical protein
MKEEELQGKKEHFFSSALNFEGPLRKERKHLLLHLKDQDPLSMGKKRLTLGSRQY